jgi:hypothetical protein
MAVSDKELKRLYETFSQRRDNKEAVDKIGHENAAPRGLGAAMEVEHARMNALAGGPQPTHTMHGCWSGMAATVEREVPSAKA